VRVDVPLVRLIAHQPSGAGGVDTTTDHGPTQADIADHRHSVSLVPRTPTTAAGTVTLHGERTTTSFAHITQRTAESSYSNRPLTSLSSTFNL